MSKKEWSWMDKDETEEELDDINIEYKNSNIVLIISFVVALIAMGVLFILSTKIN